ncbi:MAG: hypothetical protein E5V51_00185 [Mesorhizobium sp.]|nr:hypothetical protein EOA35_01170 [Mesorhizobium sp. M8A.F.Ca.ET.023.01.1.1]TIW90622.1 MAG: hypothetical protein E5V51_00185 [Mesorhizobium sp.]
MVSKVVAIARGYFGGVIREPGEVFAIPAELWADEKLRPKWCREVGAAEAADDGEGGEGDGDETAVEDAKPAKGKGKGGRKPKPETIQPADAEPFADAPAPVRAKSEINDALGTTQPDWIAPGGKPAAVAD